MSTSKKNMSESSTPESVLASLAKVLAQPGVRIGMGEHAALRRMNPQEPGAAAAIVCRLLLERDVTLDDDNGDQLLRWCVIVHALALARGAHSKAVKIGDALVKIRFISTDGREHRINQLLGADAAMLAQLIPRLARRLHANGAEMDFLPLMELMLTAGRDEVRADAVRLQVASSCALALHNANKSKS